MLFTLQDEQLLRLCLLALTFLLHSPGHFPHVSQSSSFWNQPKPVALELRWLWVTPTAFKIKSKLLSLASVQFSSVAQLCPTLCDPMNHSTPGLPVDHQLLEVTQTHVHWVGDAIQPSHPLSSPSPPAFNLSQNQGLFKWVSFLHQVAKSIGVSASASVLPMNTQDWSPLEWTDWISLQTKGLSRVFSNTTVQKHQFFDSQLSSQFNTHIHTWPLEKP